MNTSQGSTITYFVGGHYEVTGSVITKYYYAGSQRIAMRTNGTLNYLLGDHLGSTSLTTDALGIVISEMRYKAWGETRYASGTSPTKYQYTGQYSYTADFGLHFYNARWYDSSLSRFAQADTIVPPGVQGYDRYAYVNNSPVNYTDPTGHRCADGDEDIWGFCNYTPPQTSTSPPTPSPASTTAWVFVCGIYYACTGAQNTSSSTFDVPAYSGWEEEIESRPSNTAIFVPTTNPVDNYQVLEYAAEVERAIANSDADEINLICHSRGGQVCIHLATVLKDPRIAVMFLLDPSVRDTSPDEHPAFDNASDYVNLVNNPNIQSVLIVTSPVFNPHPDPIANPPDYTFTFSGQDDHNEMVYRLDVLYTILNHVAK